MSAPLSSKRPARLGAAALVGVLSSLAACTTPPPEPSIVRKAEEVTAVRIHSLPPGCFVELNNEFMGVTPDPVPKQVVFRIPGAENWYHANSPQPPKPRSTPTIAGP
jgi:hypothetical protein